MRHFQVVFAWVTKREYLIGRHRWVDYAQVRALFILF